MESVKNADEVGSMEKLSRWEWRDDRDSLGDADEYRSLRSDRMIKLVIGEEDEGDIFFVPQSALERTAEYFTLALRNEHLGEAGERGTLKFPEDDLPAWKVLLHWIATSTLPAREELLPEYASHPDSDMTTDHLLCIHAWILGDKYGISDFQDLLMLELLLDLETEVLDVDLMKEAVESTPPGSIMRELVAEELVARLRAPTKTVLHKHLEKFEGIAGFMGLFSGKLVERVEAGDFISRFPRRSKAGDERWRNFMVGKGPQKHWVH